MRTCVYVGVSLDGFIARKDGNIDWLLEFDSPDVGDEFKKFMSRIDAVVMGRNTFELVLTFPDWVYDKHVFVLSSSMKVLPEKAKGKASLLSLRPQEAINYLSRKGLSSLYVDGGKVIQSFLREDLVDEITVTLLPILIGHGIPLFGPIEKDLRFQHQETKILPKGLVANRYQRIR